jgi:hypothetical protein
MFHLFLRKKIDTSAVTVDLVVDAPIYEELKKRAHTEGISENDVLLYALKRGMSEYWLHVLKYERKRHKLVEKLFEQSKRKNALLEMIIDQNVRFREILDDKYKGGPAVKK